MTDENLNRGGEPTNGTPKFDEGVTEPTPKSNPTFDQAEIEKLLKVNRDSQDFIKQLKSETAEMREQIKALQEDLSKSRTIDDLVNRYTQPNEYEPGPKAPQVDEEKLLERLRNEVFSELSAAERTRLEQQNWQKSVSALKERHGDKYNDYVADRAKALNMPMEDMQGLAKTHPDAFLELVDGSRPRSTQPTTPSQSSSTFGDDVAVRYQRISVTRLQDTPEGREANRMWKDPEFQNQYRQYILERARKNGSQFGNTI